ncbi:MAG: leucyl aminopeptidase [Symbiobacteriia bacterium]
MEIRVVPKSIVDIEADALIVNLFEGVTTPGGGTGDLDRALGGAISDLIKAGEIKGKLGETTVLYTLGRISARKVIVVGLGKADGFNVEKVRIAAAAAVRKARDTGAASVASIVHGAGTGDLDPNQAAAALVEATLMALYTFKEFQKKDEEAREVREFTIAEIDQGKARDMADAARVGRVFGEGTNLTRDLANAPANHMTPTILAERAQQVCEETGLTCEVLEADQMRSLGMGALLGVAQGSSEPPKLIVMRYKGNPDSKKTLALVGKGLTFDSGGISIKPSEGMEGMKFDMAGGASVVGAMRIIGQLKPKANVIGIIPASENMPDGHAMKPGDILRAMNGTTIEVISTDAEGRLILADAICYANQQGATQIVDIATLTGACVIALGHVATGLFTNNDEWMAKVKEAAEASGEKVWQLPTFDEYKRQIKSDYADIKNTGGRPAGATTAALFLQEFAGDTPWVHLDVAGTADSLAEVAYQPNKGSSGTPTRTLARLAMRFGAKE